MPTPKNYKLSNPITKNVFRFFIEKQAAFPMLQSILLLGKMGQTTALCLSSVFVTGQASCPEPEQERIGVCRLVHSFYKVA